jgi:hypothetical protein
LTDTKIRIWFYPGYGEPMRYLGRNIDGVLNADFWISQPDKVIGYTDQAFNFEETVNLDVGTHQLDIGNSTPLYQDAWVCLVWINDNYLGFGYISQYNHLYLQFEVEYVPPAPPEPFKMDQGRLDIDYLGEEVTWPTLEQALEVWRDRKKFSEFRLYPNHEFERQYLELYLGRFRTYRLMRGHAAGGGVAPATLHIINARLKGYNVGNAALSRKYDYVCKKIGGGT